MNEKTASMPIGVVIRKTPGATRWAEWSWRAVALLPGAGPADWRELRREGEAVEYHAATVKVEMHRAETEAYRVALSNDPPCAWVILRPSEDLETEEDFRIFSVTVSPFEAQDYADSGEETVERVAMPPALIAWVSAFVERHHVDEVFVKRKRDGKRIDLVEDGIGDERIRQAADVYRAPTGRRKIH